MKIKVKAFNKLGEEIVKELKDDCFEVTSLRDITIFRMNTEVKSEYLKEMIENIKKMKEKGLITGQYLIISKNVDILTLEEVDTITKISKPITINVKEGVNE